MMSSSGLHHQVAVVRLAVIQIYLFLRWSSCLCNQLVLFINYHRHRTCHESLFFYLPLRNLSLHNLLWTYRSPSHNRVFQPIRGWDWLGASVTFVLFWECFWSESLIQQGHIPGCDNFKWMFRKIIKEQVVFTFFLMFCAYSIWASEVGLFFVCLFVCFLCLCDYFTWASEKLRNQEWRRQRVCSILTENSGTQYQFWHETKVQYINYSYCSHHNIVQLTIIYQEIKVCLIVLSSNTDRSINI